MSPPSEADIIAAQDSILATKVPRHLIRSYVEVLQVPPNQRHLQMQAVQEWFHKQLPTSSSSSQRSYTASVSNPSSGRSTQQSFTSTTTGHSWDSLDGLLGPGPQTFDKPYSINVTPKIVEDHTKLADRPVIPTAKLLTLKACERPKPQNPHTVPELPFLYCPWCDTPCKRPHDLKEHIRKHCGSREIWVCLGCNHHSSSQKQAKSHARVSAAECRFLGFSKFTLNYDRQVYGCQHCANHFADLEKYMIHIIHSCTGKGARSKGNRSMQLRALLHQPRFKSKVDDICRRQWGAAEKLFDLVWSCPSDLLNEMIEKLEYGERDTENSALDCGIPSTDVDQFLEEVVAEASVHHGGSCELSLPIIPAAPTNVSRWIQDNDQLNTILTMGVHDSGTVLVNAATCESPASASANMAHRSKRPVSHLSTQYPDARARSAVNPFAGVAWTRGENHTQAVIPQPEQSQWPLGPTTTSMPDAVLKSQTRRSTLASYPAPADSNLPGFNENATNNISAGPTNGMADPSQYLYPNTSSFPPEPGAYLEDPAQWNSSFADQFWENYSS